VNEYSASAGQFVTQQELITVMPSTNMEHAFQKFAFAGGTLELSQTHSSTSLTARYVFAKLVFNSLYALRIFANHVQRDAHLLVQHHLSMMYRAIPIRQFFGSASSCRTGIRLNLPGNRTRLPDSAPSIHACDNLRPWLPIAFPNSHKSVHFPKTLARAFNRKNQARRRHIAAADTSATADRVINGIRIIPYKSCSDRCRITKIRLAMRMGNELM